MLRRGEGGLGVATEGVGLRVTPRLGELLAKFVVIVPDTERMEWRLVRPHRCDRIADLWVRIGEDALRLSGEAAEEIDPASFVVIGGRPNMNDPELDHLG